MYGNLKFNALWLNLAGVRISAHLFPKNDLWHDPKVARRWGEGATGGGRKELLALLTGSREGEHGVPGGESAVSGDGHHD